MAISRLSSVVLCALAVFTTGCAQLKAASYAADYEALDRLKAGQPATVSVGTVQPTDPNHAVNNLSLRGARLTSTSGTFAKYLEDALTRDLKEVSAFDATSKTKLDVRVVSNEINIAGFVTGTGSMEIELTVTRAGTQRLHKNYTAATSFESSFAGIVALPAGQAAYPDLVRTMLKKVYSDPEFVAAIGKS